MGKLSPDNHLSGSTTAAYLGHSPFMSAYEVLDRARASLRGEPREELDAVPVHVGNELEGFILEHGVKMLGLDPHEIGTHSRVTAAKHKDLELYYTDDGIIHVDEPVTIETNEAKGIFVMNDRGWMEIEGNIILEAKFTTTPRKPNDPPLYRGPIQVQVGMMVHEARYGVVFTCYGGREMTAHIFEHHPQTWAAIRAAVKDFEKHMADDTYPEPSDAGQAAQYFADAEIEPPAVLDDEAGDLAMEYLTLDERIKSAQKVKEDIQLRLMVKLGNATAGEAARSGRQFKVTWPTRTYKPKPAERCPKCMHKLKEAYPGGTSRQKTISVKEVF